MALPSNSSISLWSHSSAALRVAASSGKQVQRKSKISPLSTNTSARVTSFQRAVICSNPSERGENRWRSEMTRPDFMSGRPWSWVSQGGFLSCWLRWHFVGAGSGRCGFPAFARGDVAVFDLSPYLPRGSDVPPGLQLEREIHFARIRRAEPPLQFFHSLFHNTPLTRSCKYGTLSPCRK